MEKETVKTLMWKSFPVILEVQCVFFELNSLRMALGCDEQIGYTYK